MVVFLNLDLSEEEIYISILLSASHLRHGNAKFRARHAKKLAGHYVAHRDPLSRLRGNAISCFVATAMDFLSYSPRPQSHMHFWF